MPDITKYIGIPYKRGGRDVSDGLDCYGLVRFFYQEELGIFLPPYSWIYSNGVKIIGVDEDFTSLADNFDKASDIRMYDVLVFTVGNTPFHVGVCLDKKYMLHTFKSGNSVVEEYKSQKWHNRFLASYRHKETI